jgi:catechol 2,3-dioxygenase-like lactoylglutathione lyase family enzyme
VVEQAMHVIAVPDLAISSAFYRDVLGFEVREIGLRTIDGHRIMIGKRT